MPVIRRFLVVDDNPDGRALLARTLLRKFPESLATECNDAQTALTMARSERLDAIVVHRASEVPGLELIPQLRQLAPDVPIVFVSGYDRSEEAKAAGATTFLNYDAWLGLGTLIAGLLRPGQ